MPVSIYETAIEALEATETASIVREWSTYEWARYCQSIAAELADSASSKQDLIEQVTARTVKLVPTIRRYLDVLSLPVEIHALLTDGPEGTPQQWAALRNHNENVRYYGDLWWSVAARLGRHQSKIAERRVIRIAAKAVEFEIIDDAAAFVDQAVNNSQRPVEEIQRRVLFGRRYERYLEVPRVAVRMSEEEKQEIMDYCYETNQSLSDVVERQTRSIVDHIG